MKQEINLGNKVDDGKGDYLQKAFDKTKKNFTEIYDQLGDGSVLHPAGAWEVFSGTKLAAKFGQAVSLNTKKSIIEVTLPKGTSRDYSKVIRLRDCHQSWAKNAVKLIPAKGDTIKGSAKPVILKQNNMDLEFVYSEPGRWEYVPNKRIDKMSLSDLNSVASQYYIVEQDGQVDFLDVFDGNKYNKNNTTVHWRGNLLSYGNEFSDQSDFGSPGKKKGEIVELDGFNIRLRHPTKKGDSIIITSYLDGIAAWRSSYTMFNVRMIDTDLSPESPIVGKTARINKVNKNKLSISSMGSDNINPNSAKVILNGMQLTRVGDIGVSSNDTPNPSPIKDVGYDLNSMYTGYCVGGIGGDQPSCEADGGTWYTGMGDYMFEYNDDGVPVEIIFNTELTHNDVVVLEWYNNNIGTTMELDDILIETDNRYINKGGLIELTNRIEYTDYKNNPTQNDVRPGPDLSIDSITTVTQVFDLCYPVGTIYTNAHNPANPRDYMGFGVWVRYAEGSAVVGWDSDKENVLFNKNEQHKDQNGNALATAGGVTGSQNTRLDLINIPSFTIEGKVLKADPDGEVIIGGCLEDPTANGPGYRKYTETELTVGPQGQGHIPPAINVVQPSITAYTWLRVS